VYFYFPNCKYCSFLKNLQFYQYKYQLRENYVDFKTRGWIAIHLLIDSSVPIHNFFLSILNQINPIGIIHIHFTLDRERNPWRTSEVPDIRMRRWRLDTESDRPNTSSDNLPDTSCRPCPFLETKYIFPFYYNQNEHVISNRNLFSIVMVFKSFSFSFINDKIC